MSWCPAALQIVFPAACPGCGTAAVGLCVTCSALVRPARPAPPPAGLDGWVSPFAYEGPVRDLVVAAKYRRAHTGLRWLGHEISGAVRAAQPGGPPFDVVTWVPASPSRRRQRGFDQARVLARAVGRDLGLPVRPLLHRRAGPTQTGSTRSQRSRGPDLVAVAALSGRSVLVIDDVATTGASLSRAAAALRAVGAHRVGAATGARRERRAES